MFIWPLIWQSAAENDQNIIIFLDCFIEGGYVNISWATKLNFGMDYGLDLYFHKTNF